MPDASSITTRRVPAPEPSAARPGSGPDTSSDGFAVAAVDALAVAWTMFRVYSDPRGQDAYCRALTSLSSVPAFPWVLEVQGEKFRHDGQFISSRRQGAAALARAAFARGIAAIGFSAAPTADDLLRLFEVINASPDGGTPLLVPEAALQGAGVTTLYVVGHGRLADTPEEVQEAETLVTSDGGDEGPAPASPRVDPAHRYLDEYRVLFERLQAGDFQGLQELVHEFTDSFFALPQEQQTRLFEQFLTRHEEEPFRLLLDQFSQDDLAELAQMLSSQTHPLLVEYARIAAEQEGPAGGSSQVASAEQMVSDRIALMLHSGRAGLRRQVGETLRAQIPRPRDNLAAGVAAAAAVCGLADDAGFARVVKAVAGKAAAALAAGDMAQASWWSRVLLGAPSRERKEAVRREMETALHPGVLDQFILALGKGDHPLPANVVTLVTLFALDPIVERLAVEDNKGRRRALVNFLTTAARLRPGPLIRRLTDPRWFLVRNLVDVLAHSGRPEAVAGLRTACGHADHRVRREALRSLPLLDPEEATRAAVQALGDQEPALRLQALTMLRPIPGPEVDAAVAALATTGPTLEDREAAIGLLAERGTPQSRTALQAIARRRIWASAAARQARRAAQRALMGARP